MAPNTQSTTRLFQKGAGYFIPSLTILGLSIPIFVGIAGTIIPAMGLWRGLEGAIPPGMGAWSSFADYPGVGSAIFRSLMIGFIASFASLALTFLILSFFYATPHFSAVHRFISPFLSIPHAALAAGLLFLLSPSGELVRVFALVIPGWGRPPDLALLPDAYGWGMFLALLLKEVPFLLLVSLSFLPAIRAGDYLKLGQSMGYGRLACWAKLIWPQFYPRIRLPLYAVIAYSTAVADLPQILLGGNSPTLSILILRWFRDPDLSYQYLAAVGAVMQFVIVIFNILMMVGIERIAGWFLKHIQADGQRWRAPWLDGLLERLVSFKLVILLLLGAGALCMLILWSIAKRWRYPDMLPSQWTFDNWMRFGADALTPMMNSLLIAGVAALIGLIFVIACLESEARKHPSHIGVAGQSWVLYLPLLVPQVAFLFGIQFLLVLSQLRGSYWAVIWAHLIFVIPYLYLSLSESYRRFDPRYIQLAQSMGKGWAAIFFRVKFPMLLGPFLVAFALGFAVSMGEYLPTIFAGSGRIPTLMTEAVTLASGGNRKVLAVFAVLQAVLPFFAFMLALWIPRMLFRHRKLMLVPR